MRTNPAHTFECRKSDQKDGLSFYDFVVPCAYSLLGIILGKLTSFHSVGMVGFHRGAFQEVLARHIDRDRVTIHFQKRLTTYTQDERGVHLSFTDGTKATADLLIGCDGIHSMVRRTMLEEAAAKTESSGSAGDVKLAARMRDCIEPVWSGITPHRAVVPRDKVLKKCPNFRATETPVLVSPLQVIPLDFFTDNPSVHREEQGSLKREIFIGANRV